MPRVFAEDVDDLLACGVELRRQRLPLASNSRSCGIMAIARLPSGPQPPSAVNGATPNSASPIVAWVNIPRKIT